MPPAIEVQTLESRHWVLVAHGGAGSLPAELHASQRAGIAAALERGRELLAAGAGGLDAVEAVVTVLEDDPQFNAGRGAALNRAGVAELDAAVMDGRERTAGAVAALRTVQNPVRLARLVMEKSPHLLLVGEGAEQFATAMAVARVESSWFETPRRRRQLEEALAQPALELPASLTLGTVGAVALDREGHLAAATSTGGTNAKLPGRVGDSPLIGAGTWADDATCAVSATGRGETIIRAALAARLAMLLAYGGKPLAEAASEAMRHLATGDGGFIAVGRDGAVEMPFNTPTMVRGVADASGRFDIAVGRE